MTGRGNADKLQPVRSKHEASERGRIGGIKSGEARRAKKSLQQLAKTILETQVNDDKAKGFLHSFGLDEQDQNYQALMIAKLLNKALKETDVKAIQTLTTLAGFDGGTLSLAEDTSVETIDAYQKIYIPNNGRDSYDSPYLSPQPGPQTAFMCSPADIVIFGGAAGGGKSYALLMEGLRHKDIAGFSGVVFRKNYTQITASGGLWDAASKLYSQVQGAKPKKTPKLHWLFTPSNARMHFAHLEREEDLMSWQGTEICYLAFDELTHFSRHQFLYMLSRNRSTCGIRPYVRATCNPDSDSWVAEFISWWINQDTGYPIYERSGVIRYMCVVNDTIYWGSNPHELAQEHGVNVEECKSVTFIASKLTDNKVLMAKDPSYMANLKALAEVDKERLLYGNWKIRPAAGMYFKTEQFIFVDAVPKNIVAYARSWDLAATEPTPLNPDPDATAGVLMGLLDDGRVIVLDVKRKQIKANAVRTLLRNMAAIDQGKYKFVQITIPQDPGQAGKAQAQSLVSMLAGYSVEIVSPTGSKEVRATPFASQVQAGNVLILKGEWNDMYLSELESFPESKHDDMVDASSDAFNKLMHATNWGGLTT
nr:MAG TPA: Large subunit terminase [Caudoviricetes sp.]